MIKKGISMQGLANLAELDLSQVYRIETAKINPKLTTIVRLAEALQVDIADLFGKNPQN